MESKLLRIISDPAGRSWTDWAAQGAHNAIKTNFKYSVLNKFKDSLTPSAETIKSGGAAVADAASNLIGLVYRSGAEGIQELVASQVRDVRDVDGHELTINSVYAEHPLAAGRFMRANELHTFILKEQRSQIIRYFRSAVALRSLAIEIISERSGKVYAGGGWKMASGEAGKQSKEDHRHWFSVQYDSPFKEVADPAADLYWIPYFDEIVAATKNTSGGTIETASVINTSFGITVKAAKLADIDLNWIAQQSFVVKAEYD